MRTELDDIKQLLTTTLNVDGHLLTVYQSDEEILLWLSKYIDQLISSDFDALLLLLYRIDVSEERVKAMLAETKGQDSARTIAALIIERQHQKLYWRNKFKNVPVQLDDEERW